jgi:hypothetical protein
MLPEKEAIAEVCVATRLEDAVPMQIVCQRLSSSVAAHVNPCFSATVEMNTQRAPKRPALLVDPGEG